MKKSFELKSWRSLSVIFFFFFWDLNKSIQCSCLTQRFRVTAGFLPVYLTDVWLCLVKLKSLNTKTDERHFPKHSEG